MKKKLFAVLTFCLIFISSILTLSGCATMLKTGPGKSDAVTGNGSLTVRKGDYLYFVNGYISNSSLSDKDNNYGKVRDGAIYRAKLDNGKLMYDIKKDDENNEIKTLKNIELVVPKVAGFEYSNLYIFGDTLYFSSPTIEKDAEGKIRFDLTDIYAVNINGGKIKQLAKSLNFTSKEDFNLTQVDDCLFLTYLSDNNLYNLKIKNQKVENKKIIAENVTSVVFSQTEQESNFVYYTRGFKEGEHSKNGNVLAKAELKTNKEIILLQDNYNAYNVKMVKNNTIYYSYTNSLTTNEYLYSKSLSNFAENEKQLTFVSYSNPIIVNLLDETVIVTLHNDKLIMVKGTKNPNDDVVVLSENKVTTLGVFGEFVYYVNSSNKLARTNLKTLKEEILTDTELYLDAKTNFDFNGDSYVYYFVKVDGKNSKTGYYLNRLELNTSDAESEFLGVKSKDFE